jgi:hypothetical protein
MLAREAHTTTIEGERAENAVERRFHAKDDTSFAWPCLGELAVEKRCAEPISNWRAARVHHRACVPWLVRIFLCVKHVHDDARLLKHITGPAIEKPLGDPLGHSEWWWRPGRQRRWRWRWRR